MCTIWDVKRTRSRKYRPVGELRMELWQAVVEAWRNRSRFDALFSEANVKVMQQLTDLQEKKGDIIIQELFAQLRTWDSLARGNFT